MDLTFDCCCFSEMTSLIVWFGQQVLVGDQGCGRDTSDRKSQEGRDGSAAEEE